MKSEIKIMLLAIFLGVLTWIGESVADYYAFVGRMRSFWQMLIGPSLAEVCVRIGSLLIFVGLGLVTAVALRRRRCAEEALLQSEEKYRELVQNANSIIIRWNCDGILTFFNEFARNFFGYSEDEVIGKSVIGTIVPETDTAGRDLTTLIRDICSNPERHETNVNENMLKDGRRVWIAWTNKPVADEYGNLKGVLGVGVDLTQQKLANEALQTRETLFRQFVEHTPAAVAMFDREMHYLLYSKRWMTDYGLGDQDITGLSHYDVFPDVPDRWKQVHQRVLAGGVESCREDEFVRADGSIVWIRWEVRPWQNEAGEIGGIIIYSEVITQQKQAEFVLRTSERKYKNLVEITDTGYLIMDSEGHIIDANAEYVRLTGHHELQEILGKSVLDWTAPYDLEKHTDEIRKCVERGFVRDLEIDYISPNGRIIPVEINATVLEANGARQIMALCRDISERKLAQEERHTLEQQMEEHKRGFYRETILSVTDGKLDICGPDEIEPYLKNTTRTIEVSNAAAVGDARHEVEDFLRSAGLSEEQIDLMIVGVGEAITNAIKHAVSARVYTRLYRGG